MRVIQNLQVMYETDLAKNKSDTIIKIVVKVVKARSINCNPRKLHWGLQ